MASGLTEIYPGSVKDAFALTTCISNFIELADAAPRRAHSLAAPATLWSVARRADRATPSILSLTAQDALTVIGKLCCFAMLRTTVP